MTDRLSAEQLAELARLEKAATQGPWVPCIGSGNCECTGLHSDAADGVICDFLPDYELDRYEKKVIIHNMRFVAAFRNAAPALLAAAEEAQRLESALAAANEQARELEAENTRLREALDCFLACGNDKCPHCEIKAHAALRPADAGEGVG